MKVIAFWLVIVLLGVAVVGSLAGGGTGIPFDGYILASNTAENESDSSPDLVVNDENPWTSRVFEVEEVWPGDAGGATLKLQNIGDTGILSVNVTNLKDFEMGCNEPESLADSTCGNPGEGEGELSKNLDMRIWWDDNNNGSYEPGPPFNETLVVEDTLYNIAGIAYNLGSLNNAETKYLGIGWSVDSTVGNEIMGDECSFGIQFVLH
jgi:hypothetical protein